MKQEFSQKLASISGIQKGFAGTGYICSQQIATVLFLASHLDKPILVEGPAGVGKTELAKASADFLGLPLIRLQCYEGLDESKALYEWKYGKQLLYTQILKDRLDDILQGSRDLAQSVSRLRQHDDIFFSPDFLEPRPLLKALQKQDGAVLLVDEVDKSDPEFEAFLLEVLSDYQVSVPEVGTIAALSKPLVVLTSNNSREMSEPLKRRCLHLYIPFPDARMEKEILRSRVPDLSETLRSHLVDFMHQVRKLDLKKIPSVSETIDWARGLVLLHASDLNPDLVSETLNVFLKFEEDIEIVRERVFEFTQNATKDL